MQKKRVLSVILALTLSIGCAILAQASSISETQKKGEELQSQKDSAEAGSRRQNSYQREDAGGNSCTERGTVSVRSENHHDSDSDGQDQNSHRTGRKNDQ